MLSNQEYLVQARALVARSSVERLSPSEFRSFADWLGLADTVDDEEVENPSEAPKRR